MGKHSPFNMAQRPRPATFRLTTFSRSNVGRVIRHNRQNLVVGCDRCPAGPWGGGRGEAEQELTRPPPCVIGRRNVATCGANRDQTRHSLAGSAAMRRSRVRSRTLRARYQTPKAGVCIVQNVRAKALAAGAISIVQICVSACGQSGSTRQDMVEQCSRLISQNRFQEGAACLGNFEKDAKPDPQTAKAIYQLAVLFETGRDVREADPDHVRYGLQVCRKNAFRCARYLPRKRPKPRTRLINRMRQAEEP